MEVAKLDSCKTRAADYNITITTGDNMKIKLKKGDIVINNSAIRSNPVVCEHHGYSPIEKGAVGVVLEVRQTDLNASYSKDGKGDVYVDVMMSTRK
jgi:hypothetical protein